MEFGRELEGGRTRAFGKDRSINVGFYERIVNVAVGGALVAYGLRKRGFGGILMAAGGGFLAYRGTTGYCPIFERTGIDTTSAGPEKGIVIHRAITIERPIEEVYRFWRDPRNMPQFMSHIENVEARGEGMSHWKARFGRFGVEWDSRVTTDEPNRCIAWQSFGESRLPNQGRVEFVEAPGGRGTEVHLELRFQPPGREAGMVLAPVLKTTTKAQIASDLSRLKQILETGEVATAAMRPEGERRQFGAEGGLGESGDWPGTPR
jgi:uncharacterized membrane protein